MSNIIYIKTEPVDDIVNEDESYNFQRNGIEIERCENDIKVENCEAEEEELPENWECLTSTSSSSLNPEIGSVESTSHRESDANFSPTSPLNGCANLYLNQDASNLGKKNHVTNSIQNDESSYKCNVCSKNFPQKSNLLKHLLTHSGEKPFLCNQCSSKFSQKAHLTSHLRLHSGEKPFHCTFCSKCFSQKAHLATHLRVHSGEKPFQCNLCSKNFTMKWHLTTHLQTHSGEKPFHCDLCSKSFSLKANLSTHLQIHSGNKPFQCNVCSKTFSLKSYLSRHLLIHTPKKANKKDGKEVNDIPENNIEIERRENAKS